jgi:hypothetical protein
MLLKNKLITWTATIAVFTVWTLYSPVLFILINLILTGIGLPFPIVHLILMILPQILLLEIVIKLLFILLVFPPLRFIPTQADLWPQIDRYALTGYTSELEQLGFTQVIDYALPGTNGMARLFAHPQNFCFAEVFQVNNLPMRCSISSRLSNNWQLGVVNLSTHSAISVAFLQQPRKLVRLIDNASGNLLLRSILDWREEVSSELGVELIRDISGDTYFEQQRRNRTETKRLMYGKSITWGLMKMLWFSLNPKSEWLGDYSKFRVRR